MMRGSGRPRELHSSAADPVELPPAPAAAGPAAGGGSRLESATTVAWITTISVSAVPAILWMHAAGAVPSWLAPAQAAVAAALALAALWWAPARAVWRFTVALLALTLVLQTTPQLASVVQGVGAGLGVTAFGHRMVGEQSVKLIGAGVMICILLLLGFSRRQFFLTVGEIAAPIRPARMLGFPHRDPWWRFGLVWGFGIAVVLFAVQSMLLRPTLAQWIALVPTIPAVLLFAALNAFSEEMTYRAPMIATLEPALGAGQALWQSAALFGVAHYFGVPGGVTGAAASIFMGWILGKAMIETRGLFWPWFIHALSDVAIFASLAMALG